ncbi:staphylopine uptake ABC transporter permease subunit CntC [Paenibacillus shenyangensis]|uniref:staphylopine uptake ABC transporter permease subunit CntC n=1 Tax=Paenibacillus sp. A9 TaxID=1284352 RepID=UPI00037873A8|nr:nickel/cobalt ABC transporter permease [Paenibacillus sp. A9]
MNVWKNSAMDKMGQLSLIVVVGVIIAGLSAPVLAPHDPLAVQMSLRYAEPSWEYLLGNDQLGRCILSRLLYGIRPSVLAVLVVLLLSVLIGAILGFLAGYFRGKTDTRIMRICDVVLSFPGYVMTLAMVGILGVGLENILIAFVLTKWAWFTRVIRTSVLQYTEMDYIRFARTTGMGHGAIIRRHLIPVTFADIAVTASSSVGSMILQISGFSFLGLGIQAPQAEWGMMLNEAREVMFTRPEMMLPPAIAIVIVVSAFHFLADSLQVALDPRLRQSGLQPDRLPDQQEVAVRL